MTCTFVYERTESTRNIEILNADNQLLRALGGILGALRRSLHEETGEASKNIRTLLEQIVSSDQGACAVFQIEVVVERLNSEVEKYPSRASRLLVTSHVDHGRSSVHPSIAIVS